jgi:diadenosine tetraphosphate (Ap4A) HIT family hydrolase
MSDHGLAKVAMDTENYARQSQQSRRAGQCFICEIVSGTHSYNHHIVYQDADTIVFLNRYPTLLGYCLVAPKSHVESWLFDMDEAQFLDLQAVVYRVGSAVAATVPTERMYSLCLGSQQGNAHLHWHVAPLPPGVAYDEQQFSALRAENGVLDISDLALADLATAIRSKM